MKYMEEDMYGASHDNDVRNGLLMKYTEGPGIMGEWIKLGTPRFQDAEMGIRQYVLLKILKEYWIEVDIFFSLSRPRIMHESTRYVNFSKPECAKGVVLENYIMYVIFAFWGIFQKRVKLSPAFSPLYWLKSSLYTMYFTRGPIVTLKFILSLPSFIIFNEIISYISINTRGWNEEIRREEKWMFLCSSDQMEIIQP